MRSPSLNGKGDEENRFGEAAASPNSPDLTEHGIANATKKWNGYVNFTREPIIETIISPKEGCKLLVRSSKGGGPAEEYYVDAVEVVSFGRAFFFRSMERPKAFLVPASDYEILEVKEARVALKNVSHDRNIKIGGGREASLKHREPVQERESEPATEEEQPAQAEGAGSETAVSSRMDKRRDRRRRRHRRSDDEWSDRREPQQQQPHAEGESKVQGGGAEDETKVSSSMFSSLIPPPPKLITETLSRYKDKEFTEGTPPAKEVDQEKPKKKPPQEETPNSESAPLHRIATTSIPEALETSTHFSPLPTDRNSFFF
jgi:hypothetical protein